jgi:hypothetical protein
MHVAFDSNLALNPFAAFLDPRAAMQAHDRLADTLASGCRRWSPLDKPAALADPEESALAFDAAIESEAAPEVIEDPSTPSA